MVIPQIGLSVAFICLISFADQHVFLKQPVLKRKWGENYSNLAFYLLGINTIHICNVLFGEKCL